MLLAILVAQATPPVTPASPDPLAELVASKRRMACERPATSRVSKPHPGAEQFYAGAFTIDAQGRVFGEERRYLYANSGWKALEGLRRGKDCMDAWTVVGKRIHPVECPTCTFAIEIEADIDQARTTCERRLTPDGNHFKVIYNVLEKGDTIEVTFESGKRLATGVKAGEGRYAWTSDQTCTWF